MGVVWFCAMETLKFGRSVVLKVGAGWGREGGHLEVGTGIYIVQNK